MNPLLSSRNLFILRKVNPKETQNHDLFVINEFDGFINYLENQMAVNVFGNKQSAKRDERTKFARNVLIDMIGKEEFIRVRKLLQESNALEETKSRYKNLDKTEKLVFKLIAKGFTQTEIAELLSLTKTKVNKSRQCIYEKMNFINTNDLLLYATRNNIV